MRGPISEAPSRRGQLIFPFIFALASLFLLTKLTLEMAKISREKIRHQFAVDSAAFIEMTNYSDFLNRSAYVNGAFPQRIFYEGFAHTKIDRKDSNKSDSLYDILYKNGTFPRTDQASGDTSLDPYKTWNLRFGGCGTGKNLHPPDMASCAPSGGMGTGGGGKSGAVETGVGGVAIGGTGRLDIITMKDALDYWLAWDDVQDIYKLYVQIYTLLGQVEDAQFSVFKRLTGNHNFFRKSYFLNTRDQDASVDAGAIGAAFFDAYTFEPKPYCVQELMIYGNKPTSNAFQPYQIWAPNSPIQMATTIANCQPSSGLFQLESIPDTQLQNMSIIHPALSNYPGFPVFQSYSLPKENFFLVDFNNLVSCKAGGIQGPCVHATIMLSGGRLWPDPTPKFQTRLYP